MNQSMQILMTRGARGGRARDLHDFFNVTWQTLTLDVRKAHKIVTKSDLKFV